MHHHEQETADREGTCLCAHALCLHCRGWKRKMAVIYMFLILLWEGRKSPSDKSLEGSARGAFRPPRFYCFSSAEKHAQMP